MTKTSCIQKCNPWNYSLNMQRGSAAFAVIATGIILGTYGGVFAHHMGTFNLDAKILIGSGSALGVAGLSWLVPKALMAAGKKPEVVHETIELDGDGRWTVISRDLKEGHKAALATLIEEQGKVVVWIRLMSQGRAVKDRRGFFNDFEDTYGYDSRLIETTRVAQGTQFEIRTYTRSTK